MKWRSIEFRLAGLFSLLLLAGLASLGAVLWFGVEYNMVSAVDTLLEARATNLAKFVDSEFGNVFVEGSLVTDSVKAAVGHDHSLGAATDFMFNVGAEVLDHDFRLCAEIDRVEGQRPGKCSCRLLPLHVRIIVAYLHETGIAHGGLNGDARWHSTFSGFTLPSKRPRWRITKRS